MMDDVTIEPCPFCLAPFEADGWVKMARHDVTGKWSVDCLRCGACGPIADDMLGAANKWNARQSPADIDLLAAAKAAHFVLNIVYQREPGTNEAGAIAALQAAIAKAEAIHE